MPVTLTAAQLDRAVGAVVATAAGDALGAGYEFGPPLEPGTAVVMAGGGPFNWAPGEWTDDTSMATPILRAVASGRTLDESTLDGIVATWALWAQTAKDVGSQTRAVLSRLTSPTAAAARVAARQVHEAHGHSAGNGSLMRTAPLVLAFLSDGDELALAEAARTISDLTHVEADAGDACVIWTLAIRDAILTGNTDVRAGLPLLPAERRERWLNLINQAESAQPRDFDKNGWVVQALQGAWSAIHHSRSLRQALEEAVRGGRDTDTVAAIAGGLIGAASGARAIPQEWTDILHGWPGLTTQDLIEQATRAALSERPPPASR